MKEFKNIITAIGKFTRKEDNRMTQSIKTYMASKSIRLTNIDTVSSLATKFNLNISEVDLINIDKDIDANVSNTVDKRSFICYLMYTLVCVLHDKKLNVKIELPIGGYDTFKSNIAERVKYVREYEASV